MRKLEEGILDSSEIYFLTPSDFAERSLFCVQHIGVFYCDTRYEVTPSLLGIYFASFY